MTGLLVTCVLPIYGPSFIVEQAINYFLRQTHDDRELLLLDRDAAPFAHRSDIAGETTIRRITVADTRQPWTDPAAVRAVAENARGDFIAWWSRADWMSPYRLEEQLAELHRTGADATDVVEPLTYRIDDGDAFCDATAHIPESRLARANAFPAPHSIVPVSDPPWYLRVVQRGPVSGARPRRISEVLSRLSFDVSFYSSWRSGSVAPSPTAPGRPRPLHVAVPLIVHDGLGSMGEYIVRTLARVGITMNVTPFVIHPSGLADETVDRVARSAPDPTDPVLALAYVGQPLDAFADSSALFINSMWESTELPAGVADRFNRAHAVIVPTTWVAQVFRASGVRVPIEVVPLGVDPARYAPAGRTARENLTTLIVASWSARKNIPESIAAWQAAFAGDETARLIIKSRFGWYDYRPDDPRITFVDTNEPTAGIAHWYHSADIALALGGEGFGLPLVEAMACGLCVIALDAQGQSDVCADAGDRLFSVPPGRWADYDDGTYRCGKYAVPDLDAVVDKLRWLATNRDAARATARRASLWARTERDIWRMGPRLVDVIRRYLPPSIALAGADASKPFAAAS
jgi:hypothetical protein